MLPNFLIIGSQKAGTTSLYHVLSRHPDVYMPGKKEINFFFLDHLYRRGVPYYESYFSGMPADKKICGEASPGYICHPESPERIRNLLPDVKLILTVRNPIDRAYSQYWDSRRKLKEKRTFEKVVAESLNDQYEPGKSGYFNRGVYMTYIKKYLSLFDRDQLLVLMFDELKNDPGSFYQKLFSFLNINKTFECQAMLKSYNYSSIRSNPLYTIVFQHPSLLKFFPWKLKKLFQWGKKVRFEYPKMEDTSKQVLIRFYKSWNDELGDFLNENLSHWNQ